MGGVALLSSLGVWELRSYVHSGWKRVFNINCMAEEVSCEASNSSRSSTKPQKLLPTVKNLIPSFDIPSLLIQKRCPVDR